MTSDRGMQWTPFLSQHCGTPLSSSSSSRTPSSCPSWAFALGASPSCDSLPLGFPLLTLGFYSNSHSSERAFLTFIAKFHPQIFVISTYCCWYFFSYSIHYFQKPSKLCISIYSFSFPYTWKCHKSRHYLTYSYHVLSSSLVSGTQ